MAYTTEAIRNIALVGHAGSGKTTLTEALLHQTGVIAARGSLEKGGTVSDFDPLEKEHQHSLNPAIVHFEHGDAHVNLIDAPGSPDFVGRSLSCLSAVETAAVVVDARMGIETLTRRMMNRAKELDLCRAIIVNKVDSGTELEALVESLRETFGRECLPINLPAQGGAKVIDCFFNPAGEDTDFSSVADAHTAIIEQVIEVDEELMEVYLEKGQDINAEQLHDPFAKALREGHLVPICFTSGETGAGLTELIEIFTRLMPNPTEGNPPTFFKGDGSDGDEVHPSEEADAPVLTHVFRVATDPFVGTLSMFRIYQGTITKDSTLYAGDNRKALRLGHLYALQGKEHVEIAKGIPGDICALAKIDEIHQDHVLHDGEISPDLHLKTVVFPKPMYGLAVDAKKRGDEAKLGQALHRLAGEDPCLEVLHNAATNETVIQGMGELHLRMVLQWMRDRFHVEVDTHPPKIAYMETVMSKAEGHCRHKKQTGGAGQFGEVFLRIEPLERGSGFEFVSEVVGGAIPTNLIPAVEKGVRQVYAHGAIAGYPMQDIRVIVHDGKYHPVDSKEVAFVTAGRKAFQDAIQKAKPVLLEPVVDLEVTCPEDAMGTVSSDVSGRRGQIGGTEVIGSGLLKISAKAPLGEMMDYQSRLKSVTGGRGNYAMDFSHYAAVPRDLQKKIVEEHTPHPEDD